MKLSSPDQPKGNQVNDVILVSGKIIEKLRRSTFAGFKTKAPKIIKSRLIHATRPACAHNRPANPKKPWSATWPDAPLHLPQFPAFPRDINFIGPFPQATTLKKGVQLLEILRIEAA